MPSKRALEDDATSLPPTASTSTALVVSDTNTIGASETDTERHDREALALLRARWKEILDAPTPVDGGKTVRWRWEWNFDKGRPTRFNPPIVEDVVAEEINDRWSVKKGDKVEEILIDWDIPDHVLRGWKRRRDYKYTDKWEAEWLKGKTGINRLLLRELIKLLKNEKVLLLPESEWAEPPPSLMPLNPQPRPTTERIGNIPALSMVPDTSRWTIGLRFESAWKSKTRPLPSISTEERVLIDRALEILAGGKQMIFLTGAGISAAAGIPTFRSKDGLLKSKGKEAFSLSALSSPEDNEEHNRTMGNFAKMAQIASADPTYWHFLQAYFIEHVNQPILRIYTTNIDGLEDSFHRSQVRLPNINVLVRDTVVYLHGNLRQARCRQCNLYDELNPRLHQTNTNPVCPRCILDNRTGRQRSVEMLQPNVVLYDADCNPNGKEIAKYITIDRGGLIFLETDEEKEKKEKEQAKKKKMKKREDGEVPNWRPRNQGLPDRLVIAGMSSKLDKNKNMIKDFAEAVLRVQGIVVWINPTPPPKLVRPYIHEHIPLDCQLVARYYLEEKIDFSAIR